MHCWGGGGSVCSHMHKRAHGNVLPYNKRSSFFRQLDFCQITVSSAIFCVYQYILLLMETESQKSSGPTWEVSRQHKARHTAWHSAQHADKLSVKGILQWSATSLERLKYRRDNTSGFFFSRLEFLYDENLFWWCKMMNFTSLEYKKMTNFASSEVKKNFF